MAYAKVQSEVIAYSGGGTSATLSFTKTGTSGNLLLLPVFMYTGGSDTTPQTWTCSGNHDSGWHLLYQNDALAASGGPMHFALFAAKSSGGIETLNLTWTTTSIVTDFDLNEFSGAAGTTISLVGTPASAQGTNTGAVTTPAWTVGTSTNLFFNCAMSTDSINGVTTPWAGDTVIGNTGSADVWCTGQTGTLHPAINNQGGDWTSYVFEVNVTSGGGGGSRTASDTSASSDSSSRAIPRTRNSADTSVSTDASTRAEPKSRATSDTSNSSDTAVRLTLALARTSVDASASTDTASRAEPNPRSSADTSNSTDTAAGSVARLRSSADTSASTDTASRQPAARNRTTTDTSSSSDSAATGAGGGSRTSADTSNSTDSAARHAVFTRTSSDTSSSTDSAARTRPLHRFTADTSLTSDTTSRGVVHYGRVATDVSHSSDNATIPSTGTPPWISLPTQLFITPLITGVMVAGTTSSTTIVGTVTVLAGQGADTVLDFEDENTEMSFGTQDLS